MALRRPGFRVAPSAIYLPTFTFVEPSFVHSLSCAVPPVGTLVSCSVVLPQFLNFINSLLDTVYTVLLQLFLMTLPANCRTGIQVQFTQVHDVAAVVVVNIITNNKFTKYSMQHYCQPQKLRHEALSCCYNITNDDDDDGKAKYVCLQW